MGAITVQQEKNLKEGVFNVPKFCYPDILNQVDTELVSVKAFLPFLEKYSFLDANRAMFYSISVSLDSVNYDLDFEDNDKAERNYTLHQLNDLFLRLHLMLSGAKKLLDYDDANELFNNIIDKNYHFNELNIIKYLDTLILLNTQEKLEIQNKHIKIILELRKSYFRFFHLNGGFDLEEYLK